MKITRIKIEKLFGLFDYDISLENEENLIILTGANGLGKTTILKMLCAIYGTIRYEEKIPNFRQAFVFLKDVVDTNGKELDNILEVESDRNPLFLVPKFLETSCFEIIEYNRKHQPLFIPEDDTPKPPKNASKYQRFLGFHGFGKKALLIEVQRLLKIENTDIKKTIKVFASNLSWRLRSVQFEYNRFSKELDSTFPKRLMQRFEILNQEDFHRRSQQLQEKLHLLKTFGLWEEEQDALPYEIENARVLSVYVADMEQKVGVFDEILAQLSLFTDIINERRFFLKKLVIDQEKGFKCVIEIEGKEQEIPLEDLSSGEQHEIVVLYELIFNADENTLVLIDEPEVSLHVTWQRQFVKDLLKIIKLRGMQVIVATHSPQIIANRWDLVHNLTPEGEEVEDEEA